MTWSRHETIREVQVHVQLWEKQGVEYLMDQPVIEPPDPCATSLESIMWLLTSFPVCDFASDNHVNCVRSEWDPFRSVDYVHNSFGINCFGVLRYRILQLQSYLLNDTV